MHPSFHQLFFIVIAFLIGVKTRKAKDSKAAAEAVTETVNDDAKA